MLSLKMNIHLSSLPVISSLVKSFYGTVLIQLPVITELEGLTSNASGFKGLCSTGGILYLVAICRS